jgi:hypothetical protein
MTLYIRSWSESTLRQALLISNRSNKDIEQILHQFWSLYEHEVKNNFDQLLNIYMNYTYLILKKKEEKPWVEAKIYKQNNQNIGLYKSVSQ